MFSQGQSLASLIANEFNEAASDLHLSVDWPRCYFVIVVYDNKYWRKINGFEDGQSSSRRERIVSAIQPAIRSIP